jgi:SAM-dependent methyltransferase
VRLSEEEVLAGYDRVSALYPFIPPVSLWRAWECAAYARYRLPEPVLDIGCGDGRFFRLLWPHIRRVVGVELDPAVADQAVASGVYERVLRTPANRIPDRETGYASVFANCSLEHMDDLDGVLRAVYRALAPGGRFLCSVVTDRFVAWPVLPALIAAAAGADRAQGLQAGYLRYHHLVSPLTTPAWCQRLEAAGFGVREHIPILPELTARLFLALDQLWHLPGASPGPAELGFELEIFLGRHPRFPAALRHILRGVLEMEVDHHRAAGAVFLAEKP